MNIVWELCDLSQGGPGAESEPVELTERLAGSKITVPLNGAREAEVPLSLEDPAVDLVSAYDTVLRATLHYHDGVTDPEIIFCGRMVTPDTSASEQGEVMVVRAFDPFFYLSEGGIVEMSDYDDLLGLIAVPDRNDISQWIKGILVMSDHDDFGVSLGSFDVAGFIILPDVGTGPSIGAEVERFSQMSGGPDFELVPVDETDGTLARFDAHYPRQGSDLSATVRFRYGTDGDEDGSARAFTHSPTDICNRFVAIGQPTDYIAPVYDAIHSASRTALGTWERSGAFDTADVGLLELYAKSEVSQAAYGIGFFGFDSAPMALDDTDAEQPPIFGPSGDFWVGDTIGLDAVLDGKTYDLEGRVVEGSITEEENGQLVAGIECTPAASTSGVTGASGTRFVVTNG